MYPASVDPPFDEQQGQGGAGDDPPPQLQARLAAGVYEGFADAAGGREGGDDVAFDVIAVVLSGAQRNATFGLVVVEESRQELGERGFGTVRVKALLALDV